MKNVSSYHMHWVEKKQKILEESTPAKNFNALYFLSLVSFHIYMCIFKLFWFLVL